MMNPRHDLPLVGGLGRKVEPPVLGPDKAKQVEQAVKNFETESYDFVVIHIDPSKPEAFEIIGGSGITPRPDEPLTGAGLRTRGGL